MLSGATDPEFESPGHSKKLRWSLLGAFGGMLLLMILAGVDSLRSLRKLNQVSGEVSQRFSARSQALITVVVSFHVYADQMEEYMLSDALVERDLHAGHQPERDRREQEVGCGRRHDAESRNSCGQQKRAAA